MNGDSDIIDKEYMKQVESEGRIKLESGGSKAELLGKMTFYVASPFDDEIVDLIVKMGGKVINEPRRGVIVLVKYKNQLDSRFTNIYSYDFIIDTFKKGFIQDKSKYIIKRITKASDIKINLSNDDAKRQENNNLVLNKSVLDSENAKKRKTTKFTREEDEYILDLVRRNPNLRSTHSFFERISMFIPLSGHTGNSIRYRFRKILSKELKYYYLVDPITNELKIDPITNEPFKIEEEPSLIKSQYTAEEDYRLCKLILDYQNGKNVQEFMSFKRKTDAGAIPESLFQLLSLQNPRHSTMSWRDRYRKFATKYGLQKYTDYYEKCTNENLIPLPMKNMSSRCDRTQQKLKSEDLNEPNKKRLKINNSLAKIKLDDTASVAAAAIAKINQDEIDNNNSNPASKGKKKTKKETSFNVDVANNICTSEQAISSITPNNISNNLFEAVSDSEIKEYEESINKSKNNEKVNDIDKFIDKDDNMTNEMDNETTRNVAVFAVANNDMEDDVSKVDDGLMDFKQLIEIDPEPIKNRELLNVNSLVDNVTKCFERFIDGTPYELFKDLEDNTGLSMLWLTYWFDCSCGVLPTFNDAIIHYLKTGELTLENVSGFWTEKDDELLKSDPSNEKLLKLHGNDSVEKRKAVLFTYN